MVAEANAPWPSLYLAESFAVYRCTMPSRVNVVIIGGGIVGLATGLEVLGRFPGVSLEVVP